MKYIENNDYLLLVTETNRLIKIKSNVPFYNELLGKLSLLSEEAILEILKTRLAKFYSTAQILEALEAKNITIYDNSLLINGELIKSNDTSTEQSDNLLSIFEVLVKTGKATTNFEHLKPFILAVADNPFITDKKELAKYLLNGDYEITEDGYLLAYKSVNTDYTSHYDNKTMHKVGDVVEVKDYDSNSMNLCSQGLHFATKSYITGMYAGKKGRIIMVKIHPSDIIAIPQEANNTKGRCRKYEVVEDFRLDKELKETTTQTVAKETKTKSKTKQSAIQPAKKETRTEQTKRLMKEYKGDKKKVAKIMGIAVSTVERNMRRK